MKKCLLVEWYHYFINEDNEEDFERKEKLFYTEVEAERFIENEEIEEEHISEWIWLTKEDFI